MTISTLLSKSTYYVARNVLFFTESLQFLPPHIKENILHIVMKRNKYSHLQLCEILRVLIHPNLKFIDFSSLPVDDSILKNLTKCIMLTHINLRNVESHSFTCEGLKTCLKQTKKLMVLDVYKCKQFDDEVLSLLAINCPLLHELCCDSCNITDEGLYSLATHNKSMQCLTISNTKITGIGITNAVKHNNWPHLKELRLDNCGKVGDDVLQMIIQNCKKIEILTFNNCDVTDGTSVFQEICETCKDLKQLYWTVNW